MAKFENLTLSYTQIASIPFKTRKSASGSLLDALSRELTPGQRVALFPSYVNKIYASGGSAKERKDVPTPTDMGGEVGQQFPASVEPAGQPRPQRTITPYGSGTYPTGDGKYTGPPKTPADRDSGQKYKVSGNEKQKSLLAFANRWGISPEAVAGVLSVESRINPASRGGAGNNYYGVFQLHKDQIAQDTERAGFGRLTPDQYLQLSLDDQLKVMDAYYRKWNIEPKEFFTGDPKTDAAKMFALQLAPANAKKIDYNNPNSLISNTKQAKIISSPNGGVTVSSSIGSLEAGADVFADMPLELVNTKASSIDATAEEIEANAPEIIDNLDDAKDIIPPDMIDTPIKFDDGKTKSYQELGITKWSQLNELGGQAYAGGENDPNTAYLASLFENELGDNFNRKTGQNDRYHQKYSPSSAHTTGRKFDFTVHGDSREAVETLKKNMLEKYGLEEGKDYKLLNEYTNPSSMSTGGHIDVKLLDAGVEKIDEIRTQQAETYIAQQNPPEAEEVALETVSGETATPVPVNSDDYAKIDFSKARIIDNEDGTKTISWNGPDGKEISQTIQPDTMTPDFSDKEGMTDLAARLHYNLPITGMVTDDYTGTVPEPWTEGTKDAYAARYLAGMTEKATPEPENVTAEPKKQTLQDITGLPTKTPPGHSAAAGGAEITDPSMIVSEDGKKVTRVAETGPEKISVMPRHKSSDVFQENQSLMQEARQEQSREEAAKPDIATVKSSPQMSDFGRSRETGQSIAISTVMPRVTPSANKAFADAKMVGRFNKAGIDGDMGIVYIDRGYA